MSSDVPHTTPVWSEIQAMPSSTLIAKQCAPLAFGAWTRYAPLLMSLQPETRSKTTFAARDTLAKSALREEW